MGLLKEIVKEYEFVYNTLTDIEMAVVSSVVKLESQHLAQIAKQVHKLTGLIRTLESRQLLTRTWWLDLPLGMVILDPS
ncbi:ATP synthase delta chain [Arachis hypogaea]|nr:ATP synthase delta chain [Arachis hypogaea]